jgi:hypothetical protein
MPAERRTRANLTADTRYRSSVLGANLEAAPGFEPGNRLQLEDFEILPPAPTGRLGGRRGGSMGGRGGSSPMSGSRGGRCGVGCGSRSRAAWAPTFAVGAATAGGADRDPNRAAHRPHEPTVAAVSPAYRWGSAGGPPPRRGSYPGRCEPLPTTIAKSGGPTHRPYRDKWSPAKERDRTRE